MADVEMKEVDTKAADAQITKKEEPKDHFFELKKSLVLVEKASTEADFKLCSSLTKEFKMLRKLFTLADAVLVLQHYQLDLYKRLQLPCQPTSLEASVNVEEKLHCTHVRAEEIMQHPEAQLFLHVLLLMKLIDDGDIKNAKEFGDFIFMRLQNINKRTLDAFAAKAFYFIAIAYEKQGLLPQIRPLIF